MIQFLGDDSILAVNVQKTDGQLGNLMDNLKQQSHDHYRNIINALCRYEKFTPLFRIHNIILLLQTGIVTTPKMKLNFSTCPACQNMTFSHIYYTYLAEDRAEFYENE